VPKSCEHDIAGATGAALANLGWMLTVLGIWMQMLLRQARVTHIFEVFKGKLESRAAPLTPITTAPTWRCRPGARCVTPALTIHPPALCDWTPGSDGATTA
jgi:hypothetical protein